MNAREDLVVDLSTFEGTKTLALTIERPFPHEIDNTIPVEIAITVMKAAASVVVQGSVKTAVKTECDRCLEEVEIPVEGSVEATYLSENDRDIVQSEGHIESLENLFLLTGDLLDLSDRVLEAIIVEVPQKVLCEEECRGLCPYCGINLNDDPDHECSRREETLDKWHQKLSELKKRVSS